MNQKWEYASVEWLWDTGSIRCDLPDGQTLKAEGTYPEVVQTLTSLGHERWEVATCVSGGNWLFWTLKRAV